MQQVSNEIARQQVIKKCKEDLIYFGKIVSPKTFYLDSPPFHYELADILMNRSIKQTVIQAPRGTAKCVSEDTEVYLSNGLRKKIKDVEIGEEIISLNSSLKFEKDIIVQKECSGLKPLIRIYTRTRKELFVSPQHKVLTFDGWKEAGSLTLNDYIASPRKLPLIENTNKYSDSEVKLLGYMVAEGCLSNTMTFTNFDYEISQDFIKCAKELGFQVNPIYCNGAIRFGQWRIRNGIIDWAKKHKLYGHKSTSKRLPDWVYGLPERQKWILIASLWDTDGWFSKSSAGITLANLELIKDIQYLLWQLDINSNISYRHNDKVGAWACYVNQDCVHYFVKRIPLILKQDRADRILETYRYSLLDVYPNRVKKFYKNVEREFREKKIVRVDNQYEITRDKFRKMIAYKPIPEWVKLENADVFWDKVISLDETTTQNTYDVQVLKNQNLLTNGLVTHNSSLSLMFALHHAIFDEGDKVIIMQSKTRQEAINRLTKIKDIISYSEAFRAMFGYCGEQVAEMWREDKIKTKIGGNWVTIRALGTGQQIRGVLETDTRITLMVLDDPDDEMNCATKEQMEKNFDAFFGGVAGLDMRNGRVQVIGTPIREMCIVDRLSGAQGWEIRHYQSVDEDTKEVLWKEMYSYEWLMNKKEELKSIGKLSKFYSEYQCQIMGDEDKTFRDWKTWDGTFEFKGDLGFLVITKKNGLVLPESEKIPVNFFVGIDPASSTKSSADYSVSFVVAYDANKNVYCLYYYRQRVSPLTHAEQIIDMIKSYKPTRGCVETIAYQEMLRQYLRQRLDEEGLYLAGLERKWNPRTEKSARLETLQPFFASGKIWVKEGMNALEEELNMYPRGKNDDLLDGLYYATRLLSTPDHMETNVEEEQLYNWRQHQHSAWAS